MSTSDRTTQQPEGRETADPGSIETYEIRVRGHLGTRWTAWFDGLDLTNEGDGTTVISGPIRDQAALHGLLQRLRDLGITLLSLARTEPSDASELSDLPIDTHHHTPGAIS